MAYYKYGDIVYNYETDHFPSEGTVLNPDGLVTLNGLAAFWRKLKLYLVLKNLGANDANKILAVNEEGYVEAKALDDLSDINTYNGLNTNLAPDSGAVKNMIKSIDDTVKEIGDKLTELSESLGGFDLQSILDQLMLNASSVDDIFAMLLDYKNKIGYRRHAEGSLNTGILDEFGNYIYTNDPVNAYAPETSIIHHIVLDELKISLTLKIIDYDTKLFSQLNELLQKKNSINTRLNDLLTGAYADTLIILSSLLSDQHGPIYKFPEGRYRASLNTAITSSICLQFEKYNPNHPYELYFHTSQGMGDGSTMYCGHFSDLVQSVPLIAGYVYKIIIFNKYVAVDNWPWQVPVDTKPSEVAKDYLALFEAGNVTVEYRGSSNAYFQKTGDSILLNHLSGIMPVSEISGDEYLARTGDTIGWPFRNYVCFISNKPISANAFKEKESNKIFNKLTLLVTSKGTNNSAPYGTLPGVSGPNIGLFVRLSYKEPTTSNRVPIGGKVTPITTSNGLGWIKINGPTMDVSGLYNYNSGSSSIDIASISGDKQILPCILIWSTGAMWDNAMGWGHELYYIKNATIQIRAAAFT